MISVALCTYNGAKYLGEQLESILNQTRSVNEIVICDDRSTDATADIVKAFQDKAPFPIYFYRNDSQLGSTKNFEKCLQLCQGDIIFLCDQDDYWMPEKVEKLVDYLEKNPQQQMVFSDAGMMDEKSERIAGNIWQEVMFDDNMQKIWQAGGAAQILYKGYVVTGATVALRKSALSKMLPFPTSVKDLIHDAWMSISLALKNQIGFVNEELILYRRHSAQQVGFGGGGEAVSFKQRFSRPRAEKLLPIQEELYRLESTLALLKQHYPEVPASQFAKLESHRDFVKFRLELPENRLLRIFPVTLKFLTGKYYDPQKHWWKTLLGDIIE
ncbi:glycosyltransferase family 2 protein [Cellulophaga sp. BC115SP]|uniref:glycosyltransferase family 2 protein n=1 Tax=Cellulophaga sp. BC115SP TaxID=2683263 RepID=UPI001412CEA7|nr:glycosyltransferase family 2 protein [Cellulophaga sp. BC115SP]NBB31405.1 glycosyltransferase [Cellulophaga sp. BC115SP]